MDRPEFLVAPEKSLESPTAGRVIRSEFADDPDFAELLEFFFDSIQERRQLLLDGLQQNDAASLGVIAHQLKGAGGGYGFPELTAVAADLEQACRETPTQIEPATLRLVDLIDCLSA